MAAYATHQRELRARCIRPSVEPAGLSSAPQLDAAAEIGPKSGRELESPIIDELVDRLAERVAALLSQRLPSDSDQRDEWFDSRHAAEYLGVHRDTLRKLAAKHAIPSEQEGPGCKLYFRRSDLDGWRHGGRPQHLRSLVATAA